MSILLRKLARYVAQKAASDPELRDKAVKAAGTLAEEARQIARDDDRAYATGKAVRRALESFRKG